jgi:hypothetical protein
VKIKIQFGRFQTKDAPVRRVPRVCDVCVAVIRIYRMLKWKENEFQGLHHKHEFQGHHYRFSTNDMSSSKAAHHEWTYS